MGIPFPMAEKRPSKKARPVIAQAEFVGAAVTNVVQTGVTAGSKAAAAVTKRIADLI